MRGTYFKTFLEFNRSGLWKSGIVELVHLRSSCRRWRASVKASQGTSLSTCPCPALLWPALPCPPCPLPHFQWKQHQSNLLVHLSLSRTPLSSQPTTTTGYRHQSSRFVQHLLVPQSAIHNNPFLSLQWVTFNLFQGPPYNGTLTTTDDHFPLLWYL